MTERKRYTNRLAKEKSPYLLQHAHNPVDWYPWGEEAFETARSRDRPLFLSIGYATCHWCHVMERESFENIEVAQLMNQTFINISLMRFSTDAVQPSEAIVTHFVRSQNSQCAVATSALTKGIIPCTLLLLRRCNTDENNITC